MVAKFVHYNVGRLLLTRDYFSGTCTIVAEMQMAICGELANCWQRVDSGGVKERGCGGPTGVWSFWSGGQAFQFFDGGGETLGGEGGEFFSDADVLDGDGEEPGFGGVAEEVAGERQEGGGVGGVGHNLGAVGGEELAELDLARGIDRGVDEHDGPSLRDGVGEFGGEEGTGHRTHAGKVQGGDGLGSAGANAVIAAEGVAVADYQEPSHLGSPNSRVQSPKSKTESAGTRAKNKIMREQNHRDSGPQMNPPSRGFGAAGG